MTIEESAYLAHYGILRKSGRYPWGSGEDQSTRNKSFLDYVEVLRKEGLSETEIATAYGMTTTELRAAKSIAKNEHKQSQIAQAQRLKERGWGNVAIGQRMGIPESSVRALLAPGQKDKTDQLLNTASMLKDEVAKKKYIDIGGGVENQLAISQTKLNTAVAMLREQGYTVHYIKVTQLGTGKQTTQKVLAGPDVGYAEVYKNRADIKQITDFSDDGMRTSLGIRTPLSIKSKRVGIRYAEEGGSAADGVIYVRRGVDDVTLGGSSYAQVRIAVDGTHYLKGMAMYHDDMPPGVDLLFNTNKSNTGNKLDAMKPMQKNEDGSIDHDNPFGASIKRQQIDLSKDKVTSVMNIVNEEGDWDKWSRTLSSQFLSKQSPTLAKTQLNMTQEKRRLELDEIKTLTNPAVRKKLLQSYADAADSSAVHLKAAALPRASNHVILPFSSMKENEIYAPNYRNGERVTLVRHPHGGVFEIPELVVNNNHPPAKRAIGRAIDAVGINAKVAERLSGADFDGDTVLVIPNDNGKVKTAPALIGLKDFDPKSAYPPYEGMSRMTPRQKGMEMGDISNLITDMTIQGANTSEIARAVRHSMVVIDAEKHNLNYKESARANGIADLKVRYQGGKNRGAATLISRAGSETRVNNRKDRSAKDGGAIDRVTGEKRYEYTGETYVDKRGKVQPKTFSSKKLAETNDARTLITGPGTVIERVYAEHSNKLKALANEARLEMVNTKPIPYSPSAKAAYSKEVASLNSKLNIALRNRPLERQAQVIANSIVAAKKQAKPNMDAAELKKVSAQALAEARLRTQARKQRINITNEEWAAIQAGAISNDKLTKILDNTDLDAVKKLATPKNDVLMTNSKQRRAMTMAASGYTQAEIADALGVSLTTLKTAISEGG